jgi:hypothetical protein
MLGGALTLTKSVLRRINAPDQVITMSFFFSRMQMGQNELENSYYLKKLTLLTFSLGSTSVFILGYAAVVGLAFFSPCLLSELHLQTKRRFPVSQARRSDVH